MNYGEYRRAKPRINVLRGWAGNEPQGLTRSAPPKTGEGILSGMLITLDTNDEWVKYDSAAHAGKCPFFAYHDQTDADVLSSGLLTGLSCAGDYELQTGYFDGTETYVTNSPLVGGTGGLVGNVDLGASYAAAVELIGVATRGGVSDIASINSEATPVSGAVNVLNLKTMWRPATA